MADIWLEEPVISDSSVEVAAVFESPNCRQRLWYRVEPERRADLADSADPFVIGLVHLAMSVGEGVLVHGKVSPSLLQNLEVFQQAWSAWKPDRYRPVEIRAESEEEPDLPRRSGAISGFSGGVDSCFTAFRHARGVTTHRPFPLQASVMVQGFDIPLDDVDGYGRAAAKAERQLDGLGVELYRVATSFRKQPVDWVDAFGAGLAAVLALFQRRFRAGLIAQGVSFDSYKTFVVGSNSLTDPLLSSSSFRVVPDGAGFTRIDKIAALAPWKDGLEDLRVCARNKVRDENCCVCEKCVRNILSFRALGLELPTSLPHDVTDEQIRSLEPITKHKINVGYGPIVRQADTAGLGEQSWVGALRDVIKASRRFHSLRRYRGAVTLWRLARRTGITI